MRGELISILNDYLETQNVEVDDGTFIVMMEKLHDEVEQFIDSVMPQIVQEVL